MNKPEVWLRGPVEGVQVRLQPVAHALLQAAEEVESLLDGFPEDQLWARPAGVASVGFHLQHLTGVVDRLFTYARGEALSERQRDELRREGQREEGVGLSALVGRFRHRVDAAVEELRGLPDEVIAQPREVGRARLPSTVQGLLFHAAEHSQRHVGQLLVTSRVLRGAAKDGAGSLPDG